MRTAENKLPTLRCGFSPLWGARCWPRSSSDPPCKWRPSLIHWICSTSQTRPGFSLLKTPLHCFCIQSRFKLYKKSLLHDSHVGSMSAAQMVFPVAQPGAKMSFKTGPHMSQGWAFRVEGSALGVLMCDTLTETPFSEGAATSSTPCQQPSAHQA